MLNLYQLYSNEKLTLTCILLVGEELDKYIKQKPNRFRGYIVISKFLVDIKIINTRPNWGRKMCHLSNKRELACREYQPFSPLKPKQGIKLLLICLISGDPTLDSTSFNGKVVGLSDTFFLVSVHFWDYVFNLILCHFCSDIIGI